MTSKRSLRAQMMAGLLALLLGVLFAASPAAADFTNAEHSTHAEGVTKEVLGRQGGALGGAPVAMAAADFNQDGQDDLAATTQTRFGPEEAWYFPHGVSVLLSTPDGEYHQPTYYLLGAEVRSYHTPLPCCPLAQVGEYGVADLTAADVNGDNLADLVATSDLNNSVSVLLNTGSGAFAGPTSYDLAHTPGAVAAADLDGDPAGGSDLVIANPADGSVTVLGNDGTGTFATPGNKTTYSVGRGPQAVAVADLDGQHGADLVTANGADDTVTVLSNKADGTYPTNGGATHAVGGSKPVGLATANLDGANHDDVVTANRSSHDVSVLLNDGTGSLSAEADSPYRVGATDSNPAPVDVVLADLGGTAHTDLATANKKTNDVSVLRHDGNLDDGNTSFQPESDPDADSGYPYPVGRSPVSITVGNFDPDLSVQPGSGGVDPDLATANQGSESLTVLHNQ